MAVEIGNYVQVVDRAPGPADQKSGLFYNHFRGLCGVIDRVYEDGAVCVVVDKATLTPDMAARLKRAEKVIKPRWKTAASAEEGDAGEEAVAEGSEGNPGLRYAIVLKAEDVRVLSEGEKQAARAATQQPSHRASEADLKAAEERFMGRLLDRAENQ